MTPRYHRHHLPDDQHEMRQLLETEEQINALWARVGGVESETAAIGRFVGFGGGGGGSAFTLPDHQHDASDITGILGTGFGGTGSNLSTAGPGFLYLTDPGSVVSVISDAEVSAKALYPIWEPYATEPFDLSHLVRQCSGNATSDYTHYRLTDLLEPSVHIYNPFDSDFQDPPVAPEERLLVWTTCGATPATDGMVPIFWEDGFVQVIEKGFIFSSQTQTILNQGLGTNIQFYSGVAASGEFTGYHQETFTQADWYIYAAEGLALNSICLGYTRTGLPAVNLVGLRLPNVAAGYSTMDLMPSGGGVRIGSAATTGEVLTLGGRLSLLETTAPTATANYGKVYPLATDHHLYYMDASGNAGQIWTSYNDGTGSGLDADLVDGAHGPFMAEPSGTPNRIAKFTGAGATIGDSILSDNGTTVSGTGRISMTDNTESIKVISGATSGLYSTGVWGSTTGNYSNAIYGMNQATTGGYGVKGVGYGSSGGGVYGEGNGANGFGVYAVCQFRALYVYQAGTLAATTSYPAATIRRNVTLGAYDVTGSMLHVTDETAATGKCITFNKYSATLTTTNTLYYLTHGNDGRTVTERLYGYDTTASAWRYWDWATTTASTFTLAYGGVTHLTFDGANRTLGYDGGAVFNESGGDYDYRIEGDTATHLLVCDAGLDAVQIGTTSAGAIADFRSSGIVFNDSNADRDFRVAGDTDPYLLMINGGLDMVGIGIDAPTSKLDVNGDIEILNTGTFYWGDPTTDGTWKAVRETNDLVFYRREGGSYVEKHRLEAA